MLVEANGLCKKYGKNLVMNKLDLSLENGKIIGLLGPNGSGKSTFIKMVAGVLQCDGGRLTVDGKNIGLETKSIVSYLPERTYLSSAMKVSDAISFFEDFYVDFKREKAEKMLETFSIDKDKRIKELSKGTREKVQLVLVMSRDAKLYLLDEPMGGVDPAARDFILRTILSNYNEDSCVIISTHLISDVEKVLDEAVFIKDGSVVLQKSVDDIREDNGKSVDELFREVFAC